MTQELHEQVSAFIDGELPEAEAELLVHRLSGDLKLREEARRMLRLSQAIRGETSVADDGFSARVLAALDEEPSLEADTASPSPEDSPAGGRWLRTATGGGIVVGVAALALLALPDGQRTPDGPAPATSVASESAGAGLAATPAPFEYTVPLTPPDAGPVSVDPELAAYYLNHSLSAPSIAPGSGSVRMLSGDAMSEDDAPADAVEPEAAR